MEDELNISLIQENNLNINLDNEQTFGFQMTNDIINTGTKNYNELINKPQINSVELVDNKTLDELNIQVKGDYADEALTNKEIEDLLNNFA